MTRVLCLLLLLSVLGCESGPDPAEIATYEAIAPEYLRYVDADPALDVAAKERRHRTVLTWAKAIGIEEEAR